MKFTSFAVSVIIYVWFFPASCLSRHYVAHYSEWANGSILHIRPRFFLRTVLCSLQAQQDRCGKEYFWVFHSAAHQMWGRRASMEVLQVVQGQVPAWFCLCCDPPGLHTIRPSAVPLRPRGCFFIHSGFPGAVRKSGYERGSCGTAENGFTRSESIWRAARGSELLPVKTWLELKWVLTRIYNWKFPLCSSVHLKRKHIILTFNNGDRRKQGVRVSYCTLLQDLYNKGSVNTFPLAPALPARARSGS